MKSSPYAWWWSQPLTTRARANPYIRRCEMVVQTLTLVWNASRVASRSHPRHAITRKQNMYVYLRKTTIRKVIAVRRGCCCCDERGTASTYVYGIWSSVSRLPYAARGAQNQFEQMSHIYRGRADDGIIASHAKIIWTQCHIWVRGRDPGPYYCCVLKYSESTLFANSGVYKLRMGVCVCVCVRGRYSHIWFVI